MLSMNIDPAFKAFSGIEHIPATMPATEKDLRELFEQARELAHPALASTLTIHATTPGGASDPTLTTETAYKRGELTERTLTAILPESHRNQKRLGLVTLKEAGGRHQLQVDFPEWSEPTKFFESHIKASETSGLATFLGWTIGKLDEAKNGPTHGRQTIPVQIGPDEFEALWARARAETDNQNKGTNARIKTTLDGIAVDVMMDGPLTNDGTNLLKVEFGQALELDYYSKHTTPATCLVRYEDEELPNMADLDFGQHPLRVRTVGSGSNRHYTIESAIDGFSIPKAGSYKSPKKAQSAADGAYALLVREYEKYTPNNALTRHGARRTTRLLGKLAAALQADPPFKAGLTA
jgi:hypothetical protein